MVRRYTKPIRRKERIQRDSFHDEDMVPVEIAAEYIGMSVPYIKKWAGKVIPFYKIGASTRFKIADLKEYLERCRIEN